MATKSEVLIKIKGDSTGIEAAVKKSKSSLATLGTAAAGIGAAFVAMAATAGVALAGLAAYSVKEALPFEGISNSFNKMVSDHGLDAQVYLSQLQEMSQGTIAKIDLMKAANTAMMLGLDPTSLVKYMEAAVAAATATGASVEFMFNSITAGTARESAMILDNLGIKIQLAEINQAYADSLGVSVDALSDAEKETAFLNAVMEQSESLIERTGGTVATAGKSWQAIVATFKDWRIEIGSALLPELGKLFDWVNQNSAWMGSTFKEIFDLDLTGFADPVLNGLNAIKTWIENHTELLASAWTGFVDGVMGLVDPVLDGLNAIKTWVENHTELLASAWTGFVDGVNVVIDVLRFMGKSIYGNTELVERSKYIVEAAINSIKFTFEFLFNYIKENKEVLNTLWDVFVTVLTFAINVTANFIAGMKIIWDACKENRWIFDTFWDLFTAGAKVAITPILTLYNHIIKTIDAYNKLTGKIWGDSGSGGSSSSGSSSSGSSSSGSSSWSSKTGSITIPSISDESRNITNGFRDISSIINQINGGSSSSSGSKPRTSVNTGTSIKYDTKLRPSSLTVSLNKSATKSFLSGETAKTVSKNAIVGT